MKFYSEVLKKVFDTTEELEAAESRAASETASQHKRLEELEAARVAYEKAAENAEKLEDKFIVLLNKYVLTYGTSPYALCEDDEEDCDHDEENLRECVEEILGIEQFIDVLKKLGIEVVKD